MLDVRFIRENPEAVQDAARKKHIDVDVQQFLDADVKRRELLSQIESLKALRNKTSKDIPTLQGEEKQEAIARMKQVATESKELEGPLREVEEAFEALLLQMPNIPEADVPEGKSDEDNVELRTWGEIPEFDFELRDHVELGEMLDLIDIPRATKLAGGAHVLLKKRGGFVGASRSPVCPPPHGGQGLHAVYRAPLGARPGHDRHGVLSRRPGSSLPDA